MPDSTPGLNLIPDARFSPTFQGTVLNGASTATAGTRPARPLSLTAQPLEDDNFTHALGLSGMNAPLCWTGHV